MLVALSSGPTYGGVGGGRGVVVGYLGGGRKS